MALATPAAGAAVGADVVRRQLEGQRADYAGIVFRVLLLLSLAITIGVLATLLIQVTAEGWDVLTGDLVRLLSSPLRSLPAEAGVFQGLRGSFWIGMFVIVLAFPIGIGAAVYLEEYAKQNRLTRFINVNIRNLAGVPSIVYGILGFAIFVKSLNGLTGGATVMAAGITMAILVLPIVIITSSEAIRAVPNGIREAGFGVGATRWEVVRSHVLPYAAPGILTGTVLSLARALGEAAPLILVGAVTGRLGANTGFIDPSQLQERFTAMPIVIARWARDLNPEFRTSLTAAAIVVLLAVVLLFNATGILLRNYFETKRGR